MSTKPNPSQSHTAMTEQRVLNDSFDPDFGTLVTQIVARNVGETSVEFVRPATSAKQDEILSALSDVQAPIPTDGDSVYAKDIDVSLSSIGTFSGVDADVLTLFNSYTNEIADSTSTNPKYLSLRFKRPIVSAAIGIGSATGNFSNVKITLKDQAGTVRALVDKSGDNTKYTSNVYNFAPNAFIEALIEFHTTDAVKVSGMFIQKAVSVSAQLLALKPDGTATYIDATAGGNLKVSLEEVDPSASIPVSSVQYATIVDESVANTTYVGEATIGSAQGSALWRIQKIVEGSGVTTITWADGNSDFDNVWTNRASLSYS